MDAWLVYVSLNIHADVTERRLTAFELEIRTRRNKLILAGDFIAKNSC